MEDFRQKRKSSFYPRFAGRWNISRTTYISHLLVDISHLTKLKYIAQAVVDSLLYFLYNNFIKVRVKAILFRPPAPHSIYDGDKNKIFGLNPGDKISGMEIVTMTTLVERCLNICITIKQTVHPSDTKNLSDKGKVFIREVLSLNILLTRSAKKVCSRSMNFSSNFHCRRGGVSPSVNKRLMPIKSIPLTRRGDVPPPANL